MSGTEKLFFLLNALVVGKNNRAAPPCGGSSSSMYKIACIISTSLIAVSAAYPSLAADSALFVERINGVPTLADFAGMQPSSSLAHTMTRVEGFIQRLPDDGEPASQRTEVFVGYNETTFFAIFLAFDTEPGGIRANMSSRENIEGDDLVEMTIDTFNNQRSAFSFRATPLGIQWDARWTEGSSRRAGFDTTLETVWESDGQVTDRGYMVSMSIPLRSLRFAEGDEQLWRIQFARTIPRLSEESFWPPYSISIEGRLNQTALLRGIRGVSPGNNYQIVPFIFARELDALEKSAAGGPVFSQRSEQEIGVDAKFVFNDSWVLDVTLNPDFSQVESDQPQVTANQRFEVQFPERRPFFVENADFFATDSTLVFTRRIVEPEGGIRFTGQQDNYGFGAILINDVAPGRNRNSTDPLNGEKANVTIVRGFRDFSQQNRVGFLLTDRSLAEGYNRVGSMDGRFRLNNNWTSQMQVVGTETVPTSGGKEYRGYQRNFQVNRAGRMVNSHTHFIEASPGFRTDLGFQSRFFRPDTSGLHQQVELSFFPENENINQWKAETFAVYLEDSAGTKIYSQLGPNFELEFDTQEYAIGWTDYSEVLRPNDFPGLTATRVYDYNNFELGYTNSTLNTLEFEIEYQFGTTLNLVPAPGELPYIADTQKIEADMLWRPINRLRVANTYLFTKLESQTNGEEIFSNEIIRSNWNYQFTKEWSLRFIAQHETTKGGPLTRLDNEKNLNFDLLLRYVINPWSAFYIGYNSNSSNFEIVESEEQRELVLTDTLRRDGDQFFVKFSYLFNY